MQSELDVLREKLLFLTQYLGELSELRKITYREYTDKSIIKRATERLLQLLVEVASDINGIILTIGGKRVPESYYDSFIKVGEAGIISIDLAQKLASTAGLRNRIVHEYGEYKDSIVFQNIKKMYELYMEYLLMCNEYSKFSVVSTLI
ncbi:DUF86 domain-containing protein [bacterium]|nr:DUF86 domain-containing protein [bacterium]